MQYLETIADAAFEIWKEKFQYVFDQFEPESEQHQAVKGRFVSYLQEHIVIGFNLSSYDIPLVKAHLLEYLVDKIKFIILKGKSFTCLTTTKLKFLDIKNCIAPGLTLQSKSEPTRWSSRNFTGRTSGSKISNSWTSRPCHHTRRFTAPWRKRTPAKKPMLFAKRCGRRKTGLACGIILNITTIWTLSRFCKL